MTSPLPSKPERVRVAVIDSGVNPRHPHISSVAGGISIGDNGKIEENYTDILGHGTAVMAAIQEKAPISAQYYAVQLFRESLRTSIDRLIQALEWAIEQRMDVVNLSLGTRNPDHAPRFEAVIARAHERGVLLVSAREADGQVCFPGSMPGVFSVGLDWDCPRDRFRFEQGAGGAVYYASGYPRSLPGVSPQRNLHGISFAVANMTGFIIRVRESFSQTDGGARLPALVRDALSLEAVNSTATP